jgi:hypothetical protein
MNERDGCLTAVGAPRFVHEGRRKIASIGRFSRGRPLCLMLQKRQTKRQNRQRN